MGTERKYCEEQILKPVLHELLEPSRVARLAREFQCDAEARLRAKTESGETAPAGLRELAERIARLQKRLAKGHPDLTSQDLQTAIATARTERQALIESQPTARMTARIARIVPDAAKRYRTATERALAGGDAAATTEAREMIRTGVLLDGEIKLVPEDGKLYADYALTIRPQLVHQRLALQRATGTDGAYFVENKELGTDGSGGVSWVSHAIDFTDVDLGRNDLERGISVSCRLRIQSMTQHVDSLTPGESGLG